MLGYEWLEAVREVMVVICDWLSREKVCLVKDVFSVEDVGKIEGDCEDEE